MGFHQANLAFRFMLEFAALTAWSMVGQALVKGPFRYALMFGLPLIAAGLWATYRVPGDASAPGTAPVAVAGWVRLALEIAILFGAAAALYLTGRTTTGLVFGGLLALHFALSYDRILWLLRTPPA